MREQSEGKGKDGERAKKIPVTIINGHFYHQSVRHEIAL